MGLHAPQFGSHGCFLHFFGFGRYEPSFDTGLIHRNGKDNHST